jgi:hypothetical protein
MTVDLTRISRATQMHSTLDLRPHLDIFAAKHTISQNDIPLACVVRQYLPLILPGIEARCAL